MKNVIVGTAGHIDHGKSALVEALTGTHPDRLEEERRRGITVDLGFAFLETADVRLGFIDVPGHERFVRNMLAGVGGIDLVLFVIAADEGIKPQTREHFDICRLLEIPAGLIALTKTDVVDRQRIAVARKEVCEYVRGSFLDDAPVLSVSARTGEGIPELKEALLRMARIAAVKDSSSHFRLPIDRAFAVKGFGTVVTGTLVSGQIEPEDEVELLPPKRRLRVRGIQSGGKTHSLAIAGQRTALNLAAIEAGELQRGMVLVAPGMFSATKRIDVRISLLRSASKPLKNRARVHFHQGAAQTVAEAVFLDRATLIPGEFCFAQLVLQDEILVLPSDRFILRQFSPVITIGGGKVLDAHPRRHRAGDSGTLRFLDTSDRGSREEILKALVKAAPHGIVLDEIVRRTGWRSTEIEHMAEALIKSGDAVALNRKSLNLASSEQVSAWALRVTKVVSEFHRENPLREGIAKEVLRAEAGGRKEIFEAALRELTAAGTISVSGDTIKSAGHCVTLSDAEARARGQIESAFNEAGFAAPASKEVLAGVAVEAARAQKILQLLLREGVLIRVSTDLIYHRNALARLREALKIYGRSHANLIKVADFKDLAGISRKYAIPLLEYLDRTGVTRRQGDERVIL